MWSLVLSLLYLATHTTGSPLADHAVVARAAPSTGQTPAAGTTATGGNQGAQSLTPLTIPELLIPNLQITLTEIDASNRLQLHVTASARSSVKEPFMAMLDGEDGASVIGKPIQEGSSTYWKVSEYMDFNWFQLVMKIYQDRPGELTLYAIGPKSAGKYYKGNVVQDYQPLFKNKQMTLRDVKLGTGMEVTSLESPGEQRPVSSYGSGSSSGSGSQSGSGSPSSSSGSGTTSQASDSQLPSPRYPLSLKPGESTGGSPDGIVMYDRGTQPYPNKAADLPVDPAQKPQPPTPAPPSIPGSPSNSPGLLTQSSRVSGTPSMPAPGNTKRPASSPIEPSTAKRPA
ncbi:Hypothetical protein D9617_15g042960 [Elsinoe fawcettii]|nr:Hypothetical protein D9617_15g042960 [Elsinoe fawcettii]